MVAWKDFTEETERWTSYLFSVPNKLVREGLQRGGAEIQEKWTVQLSSCLNFLTSCWLRSQGKRMMGRKGWLFRAPQRVKKPTQEG